MISVRLVKTGPSRQAWHVVVASSLSAEERALDPHTPKLRLYPIVVGINQYEHGPTGPFLPLRCAERDAQRVANFLLTPNDAFETVSFRPYLGANASAERINHELRTRFASQRLSALDVVVFYFAGHGMITPDGRAMLCCPQASPRDPANDGVRLDDVYNAMQMRDSEASVMLILDACYSGAISDPNLVNTNAAQQMRNLLGSMQAMGRGGRIVLAAAHSNQSARENPQLDADETGSGAGVFTSVLLRGWQQGAARDHDGTLSPDNLSMYLRRQFAGIRDQQPVTSVTIGTDMIIGRFEPYTGDLAPVVAPPRPQATGVFDPNARGVIFDPPPTPKARTSEQKKRQRTLIWTGAGIVLAAIAACTVGVFVSSTLFNLWLASAIILALLSIPLATRTGGGGLGLFALVVALGQAVALLGLSHAHYSVGAGIGFLDILAQYAWVAVAIYVVHVLFVVVYGAWVTANALWST